MPQRLSRIVSLLVTVSLGGAVRLCAQTDWTQFNFDSRHAGVNALEAAVTRANVASLKVLFKVVIPEVGDGAPVYLSGVQTAGGNRDLLFLTTTAGRTMAIDALTGAAVWSQQPASSPGYTTMGPAIDPNRRFVYGYGLDGKVHKYQVGDGVEIKSGGWPEVATLKPNSEKGSANLGTATSAAGISYLYAPTSGYPELEDTADYQGHLTTIRLDTGAQNVFNVDCSDQTAHFLNREQPDCPQVQGAIWGRPGVVYDAGLDRIFFASSNGVFNANEGGHDWSDSVLSLPPSGSSVSGIPVDSYTPSDFQLLRDQDLDLGSTSPALLPSPSPGKYPHLAMQGGKDGMLRLLNRDNLSGRGRPGRVAGELEMIALPQGGEMLTAAAVWSNPADGAAWVFVANENGISGIKLVVADDGTPSLVPEWTKTLAGTSPIIANGILFYSTYFGGVQARDPVSGAKLWSDSTPNGLHWQSPILANGRLYVTDGSQRLIAYAPATPATCVADANTLCLNGGRFEVSATWGDADTASALAATAALTSDTGAFSFFEPGNLEILVKVVNGCAVNGSYWVFAAGLTDLKTSWSVVDTRTGHRRVYFNPQGQVFQPLQDTAAFPSCP